VNTKENLIIRFSYLLKDEGKSSEVGWMTDEKEYERKEVTVASGNSGLSPIYYGNTGSDRVVYSRNAKIAGAIITILLILTAITLTLAMLLDAQP
jgi:hypothetical protein